MSEVNFIPKSKLYTKTGDNGLTNLYDTRRVKKTNVIFDALGDLDELSAHIGILCALCTPNDQHIILQLRGIQRKLLDIGSDIATKKSNTIFDSDVKEIEIYIDTYDSQVPKLTEFILPGVQSIDAQSHVCRTICRRAERNMWRIKDSMIDTQLCMFRYINRLSDYFFALARFFSKGKETLRYEVVSMRDDE